MNYLLYKTATGRVLGMVSYGQESEINDYIEQVYPDGDVSWQYYNNSGQRVYVDVNDLHKVKQRPVKHYLVTPSVVLTAANRNVLQLEDSNMSVSVIDTDQVLASVNNAKVLDCSELDVGSYKLTIEQWPCLPATYPLEVQS